MSDPEPKVEEETMTAEDETNEEVRDCAKIDTSVVHPD